VFKAALHVQKAIAGATCGGSEAAAIILDADSEGGPFPIDAYRELGGFGVFDDIVHGFFDGQDEIVANVAGDLEVGGQLGDAEPVGELGLVAQIVHHLTHVIGEGVEVIVFGIDGSSDR
jgi:hypothetical protein